MVGALHFDLGVTASGTLVVIVRILAIARLHIKVSVFKSRGEFDVQSNNLELGIFGRKVRSLRTWIKPADSKNPLEELIGSIQRAQALPIRVGRTIPRNIPADKIKVSANSAENKSLVRQGFCLDAHGSCLRTVADSNHGMAGLMNNLQFAPDDLFQVKLQFGCCLHVARGGSIRHINHAVAELGG